MADDSDDLLMIKEIEDKEEREAATFTLGKGSILSNTDGEARQTNEAQM